MTNAELELQIERSLARGRIPTGWIIELKRRTEMDSLWANYMRRTRID